MPLASNDLSDVRLAIDRIDVDVVHLLAAREQLVRRAGTLKQDADAIRAPDRVAQVLDKVHTLAQDAGASPEVVRRTYRAMIAAFIDVELAAAGVPDRPLIERLDPDDAGELLTLQRAAYAAEAQLYADPELPALIQTLDELRTELTTALAWKATHKQRIVGAVRAQVDGDLLRIGRLTVVPDMQRRGLGTALLTALEQAAPPTVHAATLFTGHRSTGNLRLYERLGYQEQRREQLTPGVTLVHLTKSLGR